MTNEDVPDELLLPALTAWHYGGERLADFDLEEVEQMRETLAVVLPAHEAMVLRDREMFVYARLVEAAIADRMPEIERKIRAKVAEEIEAAGKNIVREPHCIMPGLQKQWKRAAEIARGGA